MLRRTETVVPFLFLAFLAAGCSDDTAAPDAAFDVTETDIATDARDDARPGEDAGPIDCAAVDAEGFTLCEATTNTCSLIFDDSTGCAAACARVGLECVASYDLITDVCDEPLTMPLECADSGHQSDYCVCGRGPQPDAGPRQDGGASDGGAANDVGPSGPLRAFPSAIGGGANVTGGRGYPVYIVSNLNSDGEGSFRQALFDTRDTDGGTIVFHVSGTIVLESNLLAGGIRNVTIAGQTAPAGGITIATTPGFDQKPVFGFYCSDCNDAERRRDSANIIMRYVRIRPNLDPPPADCCDAFETQILGDFVVDHCSFSFGTDETFSTGIGSDFTIQRNLFAESAKGMIMGEQTTRNSDNMTLAQNVFYNISHRFPNVQSDHRVDVINNVVWSYHSRMSVPEGAFELNQINNYYAYDPADGEPTMSTRGWLYNGPGGASIYTSGNFHNLGIVPGPDDDNRVMWNTRSGGDPLEESFFVAEPFPLVGVSFPIVSAQEARLDLQNDVGANARLDERGNVIEEVDALDARYLAHIRRDEQPEWSLRGNHFTDHFLAFQSSVSTTPLNTHPASYDTDRDGMPDAWERASFGDLSRDGSGDEDGDGYSNLEEFLNRVDF